MFPTLNYLINYLFGTQLTFNFPPTFGTLVALAFLSAAWVLSKELKRKEKLGLLKPVKKKIITGKPASSVELLSNGVMGFILGYKILGIVVDKSLFQSDPQGYILSPEGNLIGGIIAGVGFAFWKYYEKKKQQLPQPKEEIIDVHPFQMVGNITLVAALTGIVGAKIFHQLEYWDNFVQDPVGNLISPTGLTFYGGLVGGFLGVWWYIRKHKFPLIHVADAVAPGLILAYGVGRIGCMMAGDGDWGIINSAYRINDDRKYVVVEPDSIQKDLVALAPGTNFPTYFIYGSTIQEARYAYFKKPSYLSFLPEWFFAFDFPHNVNGEGVPIKDCNGQYCNKLPLPVFPTPLYEITIALLIFLVLWLARTKIHVPGMIFSLYLVLNGIERFFVEKIRVNSVYNIGSIEITQAELIALGLILIGLLGVFFTPKIKNKLVSL